LTGGASGGNLPVGGIFVGAPRPHDAERRRFTEGGSLRHQYDNKESHPMIGRRAIAGLSLLSALLFCAFAAQSALATETKPAGTTAFTCVEVVSGDFADAHCDNQTGGKFAHVSIAKNTATPLAANNEKVTGEKTENKEPAVLKSKVAGASATITCEKVKNTTENNPETGKPLSYIENTEPSAGVHRLGGTATTDFTECVVTELAHCVVTEPIVSKSIFEGVQEFTREKVNVKGPKEEEKPMGIKFSEDKSQPFAVIEFKNKTGEKCALNEKKFNVTGSVIATSGPGTEAKQDNKWGGATLAFTPKFNMETLFLGPEPAEFSTIITPKNAESGNTISTTTQ
jgi:hypothetical protein